MKAGDRIRVWEHCMGYRVGTKDYTVESFRDCLGIFTSDEARQAQEFTPLCDLYEPAPDAIKGYIPNYGEFYSAYVPYFMNVPALPIEEPPAS